MPKSLPRPSVLFGQLFGALGIKAGLDEDAPAAAFLANAGKAGLEKVPIEPQILKLRMLSNPDGSLAGMQMGDRPHSSFSSLHSEIMQIVGPDTGPGSMAEKMEVELDCDFGLKYEHVIEAITAVSGTVGPDGQVIKLVEKIKFAPPRAE